MSLLRSLVLDLDLGLDLELELDLDLELLYTTTNNKSNSIGLNAGGNANTNSAKLNHVSLDYTNNSILIYLYLIIKWIHQANCIGNLISNIN
jgi:hypothetical protein